MRATRRSWVNHISRRWAMDASIRTFWLARLGLQMNLRATEVV